jgi:hypothetical protein
LAIGLTTALLQRPLSLELVDDGAGIEASLGMKQPAAPQPHEEPPSDQVEPMHRGSRADVDDYPGEARQRDSARGTSGSERGAAEPGGPTGEHSGQNDGEDDDDEAPETPLDEPAPLPITDPPPDETPQPPFVVKR